MKGLPCEDCGMSTGGDYDLCGICAREHHDETEARLEDAFDRGLDPESINW